MAPSGPNTPKHIDLKKDRGLTIQWMDDSVSYFSIAYLRRMSPSADVRQLREDMEKNPLTVLPASAGSGEPLTARDAELVGNYAIRIYFSDGHDTGIYSWDYLRSIDPERQGSGGSEGAAGGAGEGESGESGESGGSDGDA